MKLNKKLLMAALAGAIVVGGGVGSFAQEEFNNPDAPKLTDEGKGAFKLPENYNGPTETTEPKETETTEPKETTNEGIPTGVVNKAPDGSDNPMFKYPDFDDQANPRFETENNEFEEEKDVSGNWYDQSKNPFAFRTKAEAEEAAKKALENELLNPGHINNSYKVSQKYDGNWEYVLSPNLPETPKKPEEKKPEEKKPEDKRPKMTIDQWLLKNAKEDAIAELKKAGITSDFYFNAINKAKTVEGVNALKNEILKAHAGKEVNPSTPEVTPSVPENHYHENDYANIGAGEGTKEDGKKENSKEESKENGKKEDSKEDSKENGKEQKPGKEEKPEQKPGKEEKPAKEEKENTDSPNKKKKEKAALPKAGSEAEILTLAAASLSSVAGAFISLKKRK